MTPTTSTDPLAARRAVEVAEAKIADAEAARDQASARLDEALLSCGWKRLVGGFSPGATPLYSHLARPDAALTLDQALEVVRLERRIAA